MIQNRKYHNLNNSDELKCRYYFITGGRGSAKSFTVTSWATLKLTELNQRILFTRYTMASARLSIVPEFIEKINIFKWSDIFHITKDEITNIKNNSTALFRGIKTSAGNQTANLKSLQGVNIWILDEAEEMVSEDDFDTIDLSIRQKGVANIIVIIMNPTTKEHFLYKKFFERRGVSAGFNGIKGKVCYIHTTYEDNLRFLSQSFIDRLLEIKQNNPRKYKHKVLGGWLDKAEGVVFENWEYGPFNPDELQTSCGMDFGYSVDPDTLTEVAIDKSKKIIYLKEHIYKNKIEIEALAELIVAKVGRKLIISEVDPRLVSTLNKKGCNIQQHKKGKIEVGITLWQDYKTIVDPDSKNIGKEMNNYIYSDKGSKLYVDDWNHAIDGARYNIEHHLGNPNAGEYYVY